jgi:hypothetical protein
LSADISKLVGEARFFAFAKQIDLELSSEARRKGCPFCGGKLHSAAYFRSPRHSPELGKVRFYGLCCGREGCRRRTRPQSIRFAGRSPFSAQFLLLARLLCSGPSWRNCQKVSAELSISLSTAKRWICYWRRVESASVWWRMLAAGFFLNGKTLWELWTALTSARSTFVSFEFLLQKSASLWAEVKFIVGPDPPAELEPRA